MQLSRRQLVQYLAASAAVAPLGSAAFAAAAATPAKFVPAIAAIRAYGEAHRRAFNLPALAISISAPGLSAAVIPLGDRDPARHAELRPDTLVQPGSISKQMVALLAHQLVSEGKLALDGDARAYLPGVPWPARPFSLQQLIDHTTGLPGGAPMFPAGGFWLGFEPGSRWSYCNLGYNLLGRMIERADGASLAQVMHKRVFAPLGMAASKGAILTADRPRFAIGYQPLRLDRPYVPGDPIEPAPWVETFDGAGSVSSTAPDMARYLAALGGALLGSGLPGLTPAQAHAFVTHSIETGSDGMRYGNGLMHVTDEDGRAYLHHTGGMVSFSSSMHVGVDDGIGAFASSTIHYGTGYRPRLAGAAPWARRSRTTGSGNRVGDRGHVFAGDCIGCDPVAQHPSPVLGLCWPRRRYRYRGRARPLEDLRRSTGSGRDSRQSHRGLARTRLRHAGGRDRCLCQMGADAFRRNRNRSVVISGRQL
jgi:CubicO group peptidase (beta-lactamase class C family)